MIRRLDGGLELDDDPARVDLDAVHAFLTESYWAAGRSRETVELLVHGASRVVGLYRDGRQLGFCRAVSDGVTFAYLADVYVLPEARGGGLGLELVGEMVDRGPLCRVRWLLRTHDAHGLYERLGFTPAGTRTMERDPVQPG